MTGARRYEDVKANRKDIFINNFIGGIAWALGATVGISLLIAIIAFLVHQVNLVPIVGGFVSDVANYVFRNNPNFR